MSHNNLLLDHQVFPSQVFVIEIVLGDTELKNGSAFHNVIVTPKTSATRIMSRN